MDDEVRMGHCICFKDGKDSSVFAGFKIVMPYIYWCKPKAMLKNSIISQ